VVSASHLMVIIHPGKIPLHYPCHPCNPWFPKILSLNLSGLGEDLGSRVTVDKPPPVWFTSARQ